MESCDEVILLEDGEICEKGTHKELMEERGRYAKLIHNLRGLQFKVTPPTWVQEMGRLPSWLLAWGSSCHFPFRGISFCLQDPEHIYNAAMVEALKENPAERDEDAGTIRVQIPLLITQGSWVDTDLSLFLALVLAPGDEKNEGKEPETESELVDIKGICFSFHQLQTLKFLLGTCHVG